MAAYSENMLFMRTPRVVHRLHMFYGEAEFAGCVCVCECATHHIPDILGGGLGSWDARHIEKFYTRCPRMSKTRHKTHSYSCYDEADCDDGGRREI